MKEDYTGLGHKQISIIEVAKRQGVITIVELRTYYPSINELQSSIKSLEILGYLKKVHTYHGFKWEYIKKEEEKKK